MGALPTGEGISRGSARRDERCPVCKWPYAHRMARWVGGGIPSACPVARPLGIWLIYTRGIFHITQDHPTWETSRPPFSSCPHWSRSWPWRFTHGGHGLSGKRPPQSLFKARKSSAWANTRPRCRTPLYRRRSASFTCANGTARYSLSLGREMPAGGLGPAPNAIFRDPDSPTRQREKKRPRPVWTRVGPTFWGLDNGMGLLGFLALTPP